MAKLINPESALQSLRRKFERNWPAWVLGEGRWPLTVKLGLPTEAEALSNLAQFRYWLSEWQNSSHTSQIIWRQVTWPRMGRHQLPDKLCYSTPEELADSLDFRKFWQNIKSRAETIFEDNTFQKTLPQASLRQLADLNDQDFTIMQFLLQWLQQNPCSHLLPRQIPVAGMHSKWLEEHYTLVARLWTHIHKSINPAEPYTQVSCQIELSSRRQGASEETIRDLYGDERVTKATTPRNQINKTLGLRNKPQKLRVAVLCPQIRSLVANLRYLGPSIEDLANSPLANIVSKVLIIENIETAIACQDLEKTIVIYGLGYHVEALASLLWLSQKSLFYWGDIDTHGLAILNRLRHYFPDVKSLLMDKETLFTFQPQWVKENSIYTGDYSYLSKTEAELGSLLQSNPELNSMRLEQERIAWDYAWNRIRKQLSPLPDNH